MQQMSRTRLYIISPCHILHCLAWSKCPLDLYNRSS